MHRAGLLLPSSPVLLIHTFLTSQVCSYPVSIYRNRSNFHGTNISGIPKMDSICDFIFINPPLYNIHEFAFALMEFDGAWHLQSFR